MKAAIYARVSTVDKGQDPSTQLLPLREFCQRAGWDYEEFVDHMPGTDTKRPAFNDMLTRVKHREFDVLVVWKLDRLARSLKQLIDVVYGELHPRGIQFVSLTETIDTTTPAGELLFHILGAMAQFEHDLISERVSAGMWKAKMQGVRVGRKGRKFDHQQLEDIFKETGSISVAAGVVGINRGSAFYYLKGKGAKRGEVVSGA